METTETPRVLISVREAAELANVSRVHVWRLIKRGEIEAVQVGDGHGPLRLDRDRFVAWLHGEGDDKARSA